MTDNADCPDSPVEDALSAILTKIGKESSVPENRSDHRLAGRLDNSANPSGATSLAMEEKQPQSAGEVPSDANLLAGKRVGRLLDAERDVQREVAHNLDKPTLPDDGRYYQPPRRRYELPFDVKPQKRPSSGNLPPVQPSRLPPVKTLPGGSFPHVEGQLSALPVGEVHTVRMRHPHLKAETWVKADLAQLFKAQGYEYSRTNN